MAVRLSAAERRDQLLAVTREVVAERGFHGVSIEAVARSAGVTRPVVYEHFDGLPGLLEALIRRESERALAQLSSALPGDLSEGDPVEGLAVALRHYLEVVRADPVTWRLVLMPPEGAPALLREQIALGRGLVVGRLADAVRPGLGPDRLSPDPELTAWMMSAVADESARLLLTNSEEYPVERIVSHLRWTLQLLSGSAGRAG